MKIENAAGGQAIGVGELVEQLRDAVEVAFPRVVVEGEVSRPSRPHSGHLYLTLKDDAAVLPVVMWRGSASRLGFDVVEGMQVRVSGQVTVYGPQGRYQLVASRMVPLEGVGALAEALERTRARLAALGLFDAERKRELPFRPRRVALVTSPSGAVVHDLIDTILARCPRIEILVVGVRVQGEGAAREIASALRRVCEERLADVIVVGRGGGSLEDLWAFNEEELVRAVAESELPVISAVGHETDVTLCDLAADVRAKTPTEAGFLVVCDLEEELQLLEGRHRALRRALLGTCERLRLRLEGIGRSAALRGPAELLRQRADRVERLRWRLRATLESHRAERARVEELIGRARRALAGRHRGVDSSLEALRRHLEAIGPRAVLARGYSIARRADGRIVRHSGEVEPGERIETILARGRLWSVVAERQGASAGVREGESGGDVDPRDPGDGSHEPEE